MNKQSLETKILYFPTTQRLPREYLNIHQSLYQAKLSCIRVLNLVAVGVYELTENDKTSLLELNDLCYKYRHTPLILNF